jgi:uncharacterized protein YutE (UPF0331/DUF86 family)
VNDKMWNTVDKSGGVSVTIWDKAEALILNLFLALQATSDLALHLVGELGLGVPGDARGALDLLARTNVVNPYPPPARGAHRTPR